MASGTSRCVARMSPWRARRPHLQLAGNRDPTQVPGLYPTLYAGLFRQCKPRQNLPMETSARLLIVDDDPSVRAMLREYLHSHGYAVGEAASGAW